ncbi:MAG: BTAD domain-containing putative transcriptional regulator [Bacteroidota bacterium]
MPPSKIALFGFTSHLAQAFRSCLSPQDEVQFFEQSSSKAAEKCSALFLHHSPPLSNALESLPQLRKAHPHLPLILVGNPSSQNDIVEAFLQGANDYLFLPLQQDNLRHCLHRFQPVQPDSGGQGWWKKMQVWWSHLTQVSQSLSFAAVPQPSVQVALTAAGLGEQAPGEEAGSGDQTQANCLDVQVQLFGNFSVLIRGKELPKMPRRARLLLAYLLLKHPKPVHRETLMDRFWTNHDPDCARNSLNVTLHAIRKSVRQVAPGIELIQYRDDSYRLNPDLVVERDLDLFEGYQKKGFALEQSQGAAAATDAYHQAFAFYRGEFLEDFPGEDWVIGERDKRREAMLVVLDRLCAHFLKQGKLSVCLNLCQQMLHTDPRIEEGLRRLMECYKQLGMREQALRQFRKCKEILKTELDAAPGKATMVLFEEILRE